jgi:uridine kinase
MPNQKILELIEDFIKKHYIPGKKIVVAIDGPCGIGKTTIAKTLSKKHEYITHLGLDNFMYPPNERTDSLLKTNDKVRVFQDNWHNIDKFKKYVTKFKTSNENLVISVLNTITKKHEQQTVDCSSDVLIVDGVFLHDKKKFDDVFDLYCLIDVDPEKILHRNEKRFEAKYSMKPQELEDRMLWIKLFNLAWKDYIKEYRPESVTDLYILLE